MFVIETLGNYPLMEVLPNWETQSFKNAFNGIKNVGRSLLDISVVTSELKLVSACQFKQNQARSSPNLKLELYELVLYLYTCCQSLFQTIDNTYS